MESKRAKVETFKIQTFSGWRKLWSIGKLQCHYAFSTLLVFISLCGTLQGIALTLENRDSFQKLGTHYVEFATVIFIVTSSCALLTIPALLFETLLHLMVTVELVFATKEETLHSRQISFVASFLFGWRNWIGTILTLAFCVSAPMLDNEKVYAGALIFFIFYRFSALEMRNYISALKAIRMEHRRYRKI